MLLKCYYYIIIARAFGDFCQNKEKMMKKTTEELMEILKQKKSIHAYFTEEIDELEFASLTEYLELLLNEKGLRKSDVIKRSNMDKKLCLSDFQRQQNSPIPRQDDCPCHRYGTECIGNPQAAQDRRRL